MRKGTCDYIAKDINEIKDYHKLMPIHLEIRYSGQIPRKINLIKTGEKENINII